jgi:hypothetical protein
MGFPHVDGMVGAIMVDGDRQCAVVIIAETKGEALVPNRPALAPRAGPPVAESLIERDEVWGRHYLKQEKFNTEIE